MTVKSFSQIEVKDADKGQVTAVFSRFGVIDKDGDVTMKDAIEDGLEVRISAYGHASWGGALPVGKGVIRLEDDVAIIDAEFFMKTTHGRDTFETVKGLGPLGEWSYSLHDVTSDRGEMDGQPVNFLRKIHVHEVSPVLMGAGVDTHTLAVKNGGRKLSEQVAEVVTLVDVLAARTVETVAFCDENGRSISPKNAEAWEHIRSVAEASLEEIGTKEDEKDGPLNGIQLDELKRIWDALPPKDEN